MSTCPHLLSPLTVGPVTLRNRVVMGAMHTRLETLDRPAERLAAFFGARAEGEAALILTGGFSPNAEGRLEETSPVLDADSDLSEHRAVTDAVHAAGGLVVLQLLHAGRYAKHDLAVGPSALRARINHVVPRRLGTADVRRTVEDFLRAAELAQEAGYDGVEIMGSEGYLINEFVAEATNDRDDEYGGSFDNRCRLATEIVENTRARTGDGFLVIYRISAIDLVEKGLTGDEVAELARRVEAAGADAINTGVGWHESSVPTIAASVPRAAWTFAIRNVKDAVSIPVIASNRFNDPAVAEQLLAEGTADLVSMARPLLADPDFVRKVRTGRSDEINTCIACNQACLDRIFTDRTASCMVNPRAGHEVEFLRVAPHVNKRIAVVGAGPAGLAFAVNAAERGHQITLYEAGDRIGGQINLARVVPGKSEFDQMLRYFQVRIDQLGVDVRLGAPVTAAHLAGAEYDQVVVATGVRPRTPGIPGVDHPMVASYADILTGRRVAGERVAVIGAGGIGFDVAEFLLGDATESLETDAFLKAWSVDPRQKVPGGLTGPPRQAAVVAGRQVTLLQRKAERPGARLGRSTGWILKARLRQAGVTMVPGVTYESVTDEGLRYRVDGETRLLAVDTVILCAGQESERRLFDELCALGIDARVIGGADVAAELDAVRAIDQATRLAEEV